MSDPGPCQILVVAEASADADMAKTLADRVLCDGSDPATSWVTSDLIESLRQFRGLEADPPHLKYSGVPEAALDYGIRVRGRFEGNDAHLGRQALYLGIKIRADAVILLRDSDGDLTRWDGLDRARTAVAPCFPTAIGVPHTKRECWVLSGFEPTDAEARARFAGLGLGFDPTMGSARLTASHDRDKLSAKRIVDLLMPAGWIRQRRCWAETSLETLRSHGEDNGLRQFVDAELPRLRALFCRAPKRSGDA